MQLPIWSASGLSDFQINWMKENAYADKDKEKKTLFRRLWDWGNLIFFGVTATLLLWMHYEPETLSQGSKNIAEFGVWYFMITAFVGVCLTVLVFMMMMLIGGGWVALKSMATGSKDEEGRRISSEMDAIGHDFFKGMMTSFKWDGQRFVLSLIRDVFRLGFFIGMILTGWIFFAVCYVLFFLVEISFRGVIRGFIVNHAKTLTPEREAELLALKNKIDDDKIGKDKPRIVEARVVDTEQA